MNHEPNNRKWKPGDIVIHDGDRKAAAMLMIVLDYHETEDGITYTTAYLHQPKNSGKKGIWFNPIEYLHDPKRFDIEWDEHSIRSFLCTTLNRGKENGRRPID